MRLFHPLASALPALALVLSACGGGGDSSPGNATVTVTPALGQAWRATVTVHTLDGRPLGAGATGSDGTVQLPAGSGGMLVTVSGNDSAVYFDEGAGHGRRLPAGRVLHAVSAGPRAQVAVSALSEIIYQRARALAGGAPLNATHVATAEAEVAAVFGAAASGSWLDAPQLLNDLRDVPDESTPAGQAALALAALAEHAFTVRVASDPGCAIDPDCAPLLDFIADLAVDFSDGTLDGREEGVLLGSPFYDAASAAALPATLEAAAATFLDRSQAARERANTDLRIGARYAGTYSLACTADAPSRSTTMELHIGSDGGFTVRGPAGNWSLPPGDSSSALQQVPGNFAFMRTGLVLDDLALGTPAPVADGLVIGINPPPINPQPLSFDFAAVMGANTTGIVISRGVTWTCTGLPAAGDPMLGDGALAEWLPDGSYHCETTDPGVIVPATVAGGHLSIDGSANWQFATAERRQEELAGSLNLPPDATTHLHALDAIAGARMPLMLLDLSQYEDTASPGNRLKLRRSLVSGATWFNAVIDGASYQHCMAGLPAVVLSNGAYTRSNGVNAVSGYMSTMTASTGGR